MKACYKKDTGEYLDKMDSLLLHSRFDDHLRVLVAERYNIPADLLIILEAGDEPWTKKLDGGKLVDDEIKIAEFQAVEDAAQLEVDRRAEIKAKLTTQTATAEEIQEYLAAL